MLDRTVGSIVAEFSDGDGILMMDEDGQIHIFTESIEVVKWIKRRDGRRKNCLSITKIEWRNIPEGFEIPQ